MHYQTMVQSGRGVSVPNFRDQTVPPKHTGGQQPPAPACSQNVLARRRLSCAPLPVAQPLLQQRFGAGQSQQSRQSRTASAVTHKLQLFDHVTDIAQKVGFSDL